MCNNVKQCATMCNNVQQCPNSLPRLALPYLGRRQSLYNILLLYYIYTILYGGNHWTELKSLPLSSSTDLSFQPIRRLNLLKSTNQKARFIKIKYLCLVLISPVILCSQDVSYLGGSSWPRCGHLCPSISLQVLTFRNAKGG